MKAKPQLQSEVSQLKQEIFDIGRENEKNRLYADLTGLYVDIIGEVKKADKEKAQKIHYYANLLEQQIQLLLPLETYILAAACKESAQRLEMEIQTCFNELAELLGDKYGLVDEFTDVYRRVHGTAMA